MRATSLFAAPILALFIAGCLPLSDAPTASSNAAPEPYRSLPPAPVLVQPAPPLYQPPTYQAPAYQPPPLSVALTPPPAAIPVVGNASPQIRYLPAPQPPPSLLGPQRPGWNAGWR